MEVIEMDNLSNPTEEEILEKIKENAHETTEELKEELYDDSKPKSPFILDLPIE